MNTGNESRSNEYGQNRGGGKKCATGRIIGLDFVRTAAILFVIGGHFFSLHTAFRSTVFEGLSMFIQATAIPLLTTGVPLFIILTGYLNTNKTISKTYYKGCIRVLFAYLLFSILTILFRKYCLDESFSWLQWGLKILDFSAIPYGWYIEMWIGLFLLTPFLNSLYKAIPTKKQKVLLISTWFTLTAVPDLFNRYGFHLFPGFWADCYPLTFFFIGSYLHEYKPRINKWILLAGIVALCLINPLFNWLFVDEHTLIQISGSVQGVFGTCIAIAFFLLCYQLDFCSTAFRKVLIKISMLSLDMYLCCYMFDALVYPYFKENYFVSQSQFGIYFFIIVPIIFIGSLVTAWIKDSICKRISTQL